MSGRRPHVNRFRLWLPLAVCLVCASLIKPAQDRVDTCLRNTYRAPDLLYWRSPAVVKKMALGYHSLLADIYWMRAIQYYGRREEAERRPVRYGNLAALLDITTTLDPMLLDAYRAGSSFLAEPDPVGAGQTHEALQLLEKGIKHHPEDWRLHFDKGFVYFWFLKDFRKAGDVWLVAARLPTAPPWMESLAAMALSKGGAAETARELWRRQYQESNRADVRNNAKNHLDSMQVNEDLWTLEFLLEKYARTKGRSPTVLEDLVRAGFLRNAPRDPSGVPYHYDSTTGKASLSLDSKVLYLSVPYDYRDEFREKLARLYPSR